MSLGYELVHRKYAMHPEQAAREVLSAQVEYIFYGLLFFGIISTIWGLSIPLLGGGVMLVLAVYCILRLGSSGISIYRPIALPLGCAVSFVIIQVVIHDISLLDPYIRQFVTWILTIVIVQSLSLRPRFLYRFSIVALAMGACLLSSLNLDYAGGVQVERAGLQQSVAFSNPNDLAAWFGFCAVYFSIVGIETKRSIARMVSWAAVAGCLYVVGLTVSRGALGAIAVAVIVALRRILKRGFLPVLLLAAMLSALLLSGLLDQSIGFYEQRGTEETGRFLVWPRAIQRILASPLWGVGGEDIDTYVPESGHGITPHNSFLNIGLAGGIIPLAFFVVYWILAIRGAYQLSRRGLQDAPFQLPLIIYTFITSSLSNGAFMFPWAIVVLCNAIHRREGAPVKGQIPARKPVELQRRWVKVASARVKHFY